MAAWTWFAGSPCSQANTRGSGTRARWKRGSPRCARGRAGSCSPPLAGIAGNVAITGRLHEAAEHFDSDPELVDATSRLLWVMSQCEGMGATLGPYPHAGRVLGAHSQALAQMDPTPIRIQTAAVIAQYLGRKNPTAAATSATWNAARTLYIETLARDAWAEEARLALGRQDKVMLWVAKDIAPGLGLHWAEPLAVA